MSREKVLVTGGNGFIGSWVVDRLIYDEHDVVIFDHVSGGHSEHRDHPNVEYFKGDIRDAVAVTEAMAHVSGFIHLAGVLGTQETIQNPTPAIMTNIQAGLNVLEAADQYKVPGINIAVGNHWESNPYSISKSTVERLAAMYRSYRGTPVSTIRALNAYGPRQSVFRPYGTSNVRKIIPSFVSRVLHGQPIEVYGDGSQIMDMIYVKDVADFLVDGLFEVQNHGAFNDVVEAGTGRNTTVLDIANAVISEIGYGQIDHLPLRAGETPQAVVKADVMTHSTIYDSKPDLLSLEDGLKLTVEYYKNLFSEG